ncbi:MAG TPA: putative baseplate assembly protein [Puia sp.]
MIYSCCDPYRRTAVLESRDFNGIDFLEVRDNPTDPYAERQTVLYVHFLKPIVPGSLDVHNIIITGGERIQNIRVLSATVSYSAAPLSPPDAPLSPPDGNASNVLVVKVSEAGDFSTYTLQLITDTGDAAPPPGYDIVLSSVDFSFKVLCPTDFDCLPSCDCGDDPIPAPPINYLAKDYLSFRQLMLDRMAFLTPGWQERHAADEGIALVELLAYAADYLSYRQDAIATEAYLGTARRRVSVKRHVRLVDYFLHDGSNARVWVQVRVKPGIAIKTTLKKGDNTDSSTITRFLTRVNGFAGKPLLHLDSPDYQSALDQGAQVFEPMYDTDLYADHNEIHFYTWGNQNCCLPKGATSATLLGCYPHLQPGNVLILKEVLGPETGVPEDADPAHRHAVCLVAVTPGTDPLYPIADDASYPVCGSDQPGIPVTGIQWAAADALPFPLCLSSRQGNAYYDTVSIALGNIVLADHGLSSVDTTTSSLIPARVPALDPALTPVEADCDRCHPSPPVSKAPRYYPQLAGTPLTQAAPLDSLASASSAMQWQVSSTLPAIVLFERPLLGEDTGIEWTPLKDLLKSNASDREFVVETESDGTSWLRFGDGITGARPAPGTIFTAAYRTGNGKIGNIGAGSLAYIATADPDIISVIPDSDIINNPMPAQGGAEPETIAHARQNAPSAFRTQERGVIAADYEMLARQIDSTVQRAACTYRWTGSWRTAFVSIDRLNGAPVDQAFEDSMRNGLEPFRMAGQDLEVNGPVYVSLKIKMDVCVNMDFFTGDVEKALLKVFSDRRLPDGTPGVFHPDNFTFGQTLYLSPLYAAAQSVPGVDSVKITQFHRQQNPIPALPPGGQLQLGKLEIARVDNDRNHPEHGVFKLSMQGGKK